MRVSRIAVKQYLLIYCMLLMNQSVLRDSFFSTDFIAFGIFLALATVYAFYKNKHIVRFMLGSLALCIFTRVLVGGVGIGIWATWMSMILVTYTAIKTDINHFLDRLIKLVVLFAGISLVFWGLSLISIELVQKMMVFHYKMRTNYAREYIDSVRFNKIHYDAYGGIVYCVNMCHPRRNCGIFTEPGVYQMVLNSAIFVLMFLKDYISIGEKKRYRYVLILILTVITTQSTTGILSLLVLLFFVLAKKKLSKFQKRLILGMMAIVVIVLGQYAIRGKDSFLYATIIKKLFTSSGKFSFAASSGSARVGTILICLMSMIKNPLGVGYDRLQELLNTDVTGFVAASIFETGAACGVVMLVLIIWWIASPIIKTSLLSRYGKIVFLAIYFNTIMSQSSEFYPFLIFIPIVLKICAEAKRKNKETLTNQSSIGVKI